MLDHSRVNYSDLGDWPDLDHVLFMVQGGVEVGLSPTWVTWMVSGAECFSKGI